MKMPPRYILTWVDFASRVDVPTHVSICEAANIGPRLLLLVPALLLWWCLLLPAASVVPALLLLTSLRGVPRCWVLHKTGLLLEAWLHRVLCWGGLLGRCCHGSSGRGAVAKPWLLLLLLLAIKTWLGRRRGRLDCRLCRRRGRLLSCPWLASWAGTPAWLLWWGHALLLLLLLPLLRGSRLLLLL